MDIGVISLGVTGHRVHLLTVLQTLYGAKIKQSVCDWLQAEAPRGQSSSPNIVKALLHVSHTGSGTNQTSYPKLIGDSFHWLMRPGLGADHF
jgi:hypothetical protein